MSVERAFLHEDYFQSAVDVGKVRQQLDHLLEITSRLASAKIGIEIAKSPYDLIFGMENWPFYEILFSKDELFGWTNGDKRDLAMWADRLLETQGNRLESDQYKAWGIAEESIADSDTYIAAWDCSTTGALPLLIIGEDLNAGGMGKLTRHAQSEKLFIANHPAHIITYYRQAVIENRYLDQTFSRLSHVAFEKLVFAPKLYPTSLNVDMDRHRGTLVEHLTFLSDNYCSIGDEVAWDQSTIQKVAKSQGVNLSDESANTKGDAKKMRDRMVDIIIDGKQRSFECSLHTKIEPNKGRIHFVVEKLPIGHRIIVGIFAEHLAV